MTRADATEKVVPTRLPDAPVPPAVWLGSNDDHGSALAALALSGFLSGREPWVRSTRLQWVRSDATLLPAGIEPTLVATNDHRRNVVAHGDGWTLHSVRWDGGTAVVTVSGTDAAVVEAVLAAATDGVLEPPPAEDYTVSMGFWYLTGFGARRQPRQVSVMGWPDIRRNYSKRVGAALARLMAVEPDTLSGRLLLLHGPPGTGKTSALRALAYEWRDWCEVDYVVDPERLLAEPGYLVAVATGQDAEDEEKWRLILLEDCDELIRADAKPNAGQSLARLVNLTDGLLGQGLKLLVAITTNEPLATLHPAVVRPGRCIAQIEVGRLTPAEARAWLGSPWRSGHAGLAPRPIGPEGATLAELFALRGELTTVEERAPAAAGGGGVYL